VGEGVQGAWGEGEEDGVGQEDEGCGLPLVVMVDVMPLVVWEGVWPLLVRVGVRCLLPWVVGRWGLLLVVG
jgi:hypothetical protein